MKKLFSIAIALVMMFSVFAVNTFAAIDPNKAVVSIDDVSVKLDAEATIVVKATANIANFTFVINYDSAALSYVDGSFAAAEGLTAVELLDSTAGTIKFGRAGEAADLVLDNAPLVSFKLAPVDGVLAENETSKQFDISIAADKIDVNGDGSLLVDDCFNKDGIGYGFDEGYTSEYDGATLSVVRAHEAPSITGVELTPADGVVGVEITAATVGFSDNWNLADASTFVWTIEGNDTPVSTTNKYTPVIADINKTLTVTATPAVAEEGAEAPFTGEAKSTTVKIVIPAAYVPTVSVAIGTEGEVLAALPVEPTVAYDETYKEVTEYSVDYTWYVVPAELVAEAENKLAAATAAVEAATEGVVTNETNVFSADNKDDYAVVKAEATYTIAGEAHATKPVAYAAALIKGEPPVVDVTAVKVDKEINVKKAIKVVEGKDFTAESKAPTSDELTIEYAWYLATAEEFAEFDPEGKDAVSVKNSYTPAKEDLGKFVVLYITATDALGIATTAEVKYELPIAKATGSAPAAGNGASLTVGGNNTEDPKGEDPKGEEPKVDEEDPKGTANDKGAAAFTDVDKEAYAWAYDSIDALAKAGVIKGMSETTFEPEATATNAQVIALAVRIAGLTAEGATTDKVDAEHWVAAELAVADSKGILGVFGDKIATEEATTREAAFTLLYNALKAAGVELKEDAEAIEYSDAASIDAACVEAITALTKAGIVNGMGDGTLAPKATITRAQLAKILGMANALIAK